MTAPDHLFSQPASIVDSAGLVYAIEPLTREIVREQGGQLVAMLNDIQHTPPADHWFLDGDEHGGRNFASKWSLSCLVREHGTGVLVGVLIAFIRLQDDGHPLDSIYVHRLAIAREKRGRGIGTSFVSTFLNRAFELVPWLCNVTVQVTITPPNEIAQRVYRKVGFERICTIPYREKLDDLLRAKRTHSSTEKVRMNITHPRIAKAVGGPPLLYLSTSNPRKAGELKYIFSSLNVLTAAAPRGFKLTEPQIEITDPEEELVHHPLRMAARFLEKNRNILPFVVEDTMLYIEFFNRNYDTEAELPGYDTKRWWKQLGDDRVLELMGTTHRRRARYVSQLGGYSGSGRYVVGRGEVRGSIALEKRWSEEAVAAAPLTSPWFFHTIFVPDGSPRTLAEMGPLEFARFDYKRRAALSFVPNLYSDPENPQFDLPLETDAP